MLIWTPDHPNFNEVLHHAPAWWRTIAGDKADPGYLVGDEYGVLRQMSKEEFVEYCLGGELEEEDGLEEEDVKYELDLNSVSW